MATPRSRAERRPAEAEVLDAPDVDPVLARRSLRDVALANRLFGGTRAVLAELTLVAGTLPRRATLLDVGAGLGDIPQRVQADVRRYGIEMETFGLEAAERLAAAGREAMSAAIVGDGRQLPFADASVDIVICSQVLHHFVGDDALRLVRELDRVARVRVIVSDLRRSALAIAGLWASSWLLGFHPVSRHDGVLSIQRGFTPEELAETVEEAVGHRPRVRQHPGFRVTASWTPVRVGRPARIA